MTQLRFERAGTHTTLQDSGRPGHQHLGVGESGAMDSLVMQALQSLLSRNQAVLEFTGLAPRIRVSGGAVTLALGGDFEFDLIVNGHSFPGRCYRTYTLSDGDCIDIRPIIPGTWGYLALANPIQLEPVLGSLSIDTRSGVGPNRGCRFSNDDILTVENIAILEQRRLTAIPSPYLGCRVRYLPGPQHYKFSHDLKGLIFKASARRDRVGVWLDGPEIQNFGSRDIMSEGIVKGVIQVTPAGRPIVLLNDHGTVGGYPKIGIIIEADYRIMAQMPTGTEFFFEQVNIEQARLALYQSRHTCDLICSKENISVTN